jgi:hypothetical protein
MHLALPKTTAAARRPATRDAEAIAKALGGRRVGATWMAPCPAHDDRRPSLAIADADDGRILVKCFAGCSQDHLIDALRARGLWPGRASDDPPTPSAEERQRREAERAEDRKRRTEHVLRIWREARPAAGSPVALYLRSRGITIAPPPSLRFHPNLLHRPTGLYLPAMVAAVQDATRNIVAVHRTFLARDGSGKASVEPQRMLLGSSRGGAVRLAAAAPRLAIAEGIETALSVQQATAIATWAALSTSGMRGIVLPEIVDELLILADGDMSGEEAALAAAARFEREGRVVRIAKAPAGADFNDVLQGVA